MSRVRKGIREGEKIYMRNKRKKMVARAAAAAAILLVCVGIFASSPALGPVLFLHFRVIADNIQYIHAVNTGIRVTVNELDAAQVVTVDEMNDTGAGLFEVAKTKFEITVQEKTFRTRFPSGTAPALPGSA